MVTPLESVSIQQSKGNINFQYTDDPLVLYQRYYDANMTYSEYVILAESWDLMIFPSKSEEIPKSEFDWVHQSGSILSNYLKGISTWSVDQSTSIPISETYEVEEDSLISPSISRVMVGIGESIEKISELIQGNTKVEILPDAEIEKNSNLSILPFLAIGIGLMLMGR